jgi:hypothetical protein
MGFAATIPGGSSAIILYAQEAEAIMEKWVSLDTVQGRLEAEIIRGMLEAQEIEVHLSQESTAAIYGLGVGPMAAVEIFVREPQLVESRSLLHQYYDGSLDVELPEESID